MPVFQYKGFDARGKPIAGIKDADNVRALRQALKREGVFLTEVRPSQVAAVEGRVREGAVEGRLRGALLLLSPMRIGRWLQERGDASIQTIAILTRQLATLLRAGVQLSESLTALVEQAERPGLKRVLADIKTQVNEGLPLSQAMARHPRFFEELYVNMVAVGEAAGNLEALLFRLADFMEAQNRLRGKVVSALFYPAIMTVLGGGIVGLLMTTVVPKITAMYEDAGQSLPLNTQLMILISNLLSDFWWLLLALGAAAVYGFQRWRATPRGRLLWDRLVLQLPIFGSLARMVAISRFAKTLATMLSSGIQLLRALEIVKNVLGNAVLMRVVEEARESIREGESIAQPLKRSGEFPSVVCHMIAVGERTGQLEAMLENVAAAYDVEVDMKIARLTTLLEPLMILAMGGSVGFIVFSILMPILQMNEFVQ
ncbi:MAG: type II secretion system inner membrane protein GspF [Myxococcales bacterium]|nr:type II secretion system inner membrane protein GspF [Myxococcota bacterium]MDW8281648.1 type II secretion system inner membrane protein GspF [Myxococcales bacterium]